MKKIDIKLLHETAKMPKQATEGSAGFDLRACIDEPIALKLEDQVLISTGIAIHIGDPNIAAVILPRSGLACKKGITIGNSVGLIDSDYQGELLISCRHQNRRGWNSYKETYILPNQRIAQLVFLPIVSVDFNLVESFKTETERGLKGFGSTGEE